MLEAAKWNRLTVSGLWDIIANVPDLAFYFGECADPNNLPPSDATITRNNKYIILYKDTGFMFPENDDINLLNWAEIKAQEPQAAAAAPTDLANNSKRIADGIDILSAAAQDDANYRTTKLDIINYNLMPDDVKEQYLRRIEGKLVLRSHIFKKTSNGVEVLRRFENDWTVKGGDQKEAFIIEFSDKPDDATKLWNYLIQIGDYLTSSIGLRDKEANKLIKKEERKLKMTSSLQFLQLNSFPQGVASSNDVQQLQKDNEPAIYGVNLNKTEDSKAYLEDPSFQKSFDLKTLELIYKHQQTKHIKLTAGLQTVPTKFRKLPFHRWMQRNTPLNALKEKAHEMLWHHRSIHLAPSAKARSIVFSGVIRCLHSRKKQPEAHNSKAVKINTGSPSEILSVQKIIKNKLRSWSDMKLRVKHGNLLNVATIMGDELKRFQWYDNIDMISVIVPTIFEPKGSDSDLFHNDGDPTWLTVKFISVDAKDVDKR